MSELSAVIAEEKAKLVESKKLRMLYLDEEDMIEAGVLDAARCVEVMQETIGLLEDGDFIMGGPEHNSHGIMLEFPKKSEIKGFPINDGADRRIILSHSRIFEDEQKAEKNEQRKAKRAQRKSEEAAAAPATTIEKTTFGDLEALAALKEQLSRK